MATTPLALNADELSACVSCGLCLPTCPTYRVTGRESASPRGRIGLMRAIESGASELNGVTATFFDECVQCRACDVACPSGVPFGHLIEDTKAAMAGALPRRRSLLTRVAFRIGLGTLGHQRLLRVGGAAAVLGRQVLPTRLGIPRVPLRQIFRKLTVVSTTQSPVILFTGCVMTYGNAMCTKTPSTCWRNRGLVLRFPAPLRRAAELYISMLATERMLASVRFQLWHPLVIQSCRSWLTLLDAELR